MCLDALAVKVLYSRTRVERDPLCIPFAFIDDLILQEFCVAMHLIGCVRKGLPLPELPTKVTGKKKLKKAKVKHSPAATRPKGTEGDNQLEVSRPTRSPKRRSRLASLVQCEEPQIADGASISTPKQLELQGSGQVFHCARCILTSVVDIL